MKLGLGVSEQAPPLPSPACLLAWLLLPHSLSLSLPASHFVVGMPGRQASKEAGGRAGRQEERTASSAACAPLSPSRLLLVVYSSASAFAAFCLLRRSCFVLAEDAWLARPPFPSLPLSLSPSLPLSQAEQQTFGHRIGRCTESAAWPLSLLPNFLLIHPSSSILIFDITAKTHVKEELK